MSKKKSRIQQGYLHENSLSQVQNLHWYERSLQATQVNDEEYYYQSVFHGKGHSENLVKEINQKNVRNKVTTYMSQDSLQLDTSGGSQLDNSSSTAENDGSGMTVRTSYLLRPEDNPHLTIMSPDSYSSILGMVSELYEYKSGSEHLFKYLSYMLHQCQVLENVITYSIGSENYYETLLQYYYEVSILDTNTESAYQFLGSRSIYRKCRHELQQIIKEQYVEVFSRIFSVSKDEP